MAWMDGDTGNTLVLSKYKCGFGFLARMLGKNGVNELCLDGSIAMPLAPSAIRDRQ
jgi:hypothetical protein